MCGCPEGTDKLDELFLAFLETQKPDPKHGITVTLWTKDRLHWAPPYKFDLDSGPLWNGKLSFLGQLPEMYEGLIDSSLTVGSYEWVVAMWNALFSITLSYVSSV